jgi:RNA recognition motif-containing protein
MNKRLFVGNLPYRVEETDLQELFSQAGSVESVRVMRDVETGRARGFAFVEMSSEEDAERAASQFNQYPMEGRKLTVNEARPMPGRNGQGGPSSRRQEPRW